MDPAHGTPVHRGVVVAGRYRVGDALGEGGAGVVFECEDLTLGRKVALKCLRPVQRADRASVLRLLREARLAARVSHPNVCAVSDVGALDDGSPFLVMEHLAGETVAARLARRGAMPPSSAVAIAMQVLSALSAAHEAGIVHRDVKPGNVLVLAPIGLPAVAKLLDFGAALRASVSDQEEAALTATGMVVGTAHYLSPEQVAGRRDIDARADLYQVGLLLYEMLSGRCPIEGSSLAAVMRAIATASFPPLSSVVVSSRPELESVVARAMALTREARFQSAEHFQEALSSASTRSLRQDAAEDEGPWEAPTLKNASPGIGPDDETDETDIVTGRGRVV